MPRPAPQDEYLASLVAMVVALPTLILSFVPQKQCVACLTLGATQG